MREEAKRRAELYQALADGKTLQVSSLVQGAEQGTRKWFDLGIVNSFELLAQKDITHEKVRIKPEPKKAWYRVALMSDNSVRIAAKNHSWISTGTFESSTEEYLKRDKLFIRWLTDRIEYELPEGEA